jgi:cytochrome c heme-lyase
MNQDIHDLVIYTADTSVTAAMSGGDSLNGAGAGAAGAGHSHGGGGGGGGGGGCPIDHNAREAWLKQAREQREQILLQHQSEPIPPTTTTSGSSSKSWLGSIMSYVPFTSASSSTSSSASSLATQPHHHSSTPSSQQPALGTQREVSTIPRAATEISGAPYAAGHPRAAGAATAASHGMPANMERDTGADPRSGNWIYPSERMFFDAMRRKGHDARENDMRVVVPIHNAVNERAWVEIKQWEQPYLQGTSYVCTGSLLYMSRRRADRTAVAQRQCCTPSRETAHDCRPKPG